MRLDSEDQKNAILTLISKVPITADIGALFRGPTDEIRELVEAIQNADIAGPELVKEPDSED